MEQPSVEKSNVFRRVQVLSTESGRQKTSLAAAQRTACSSTVIPRVAYQGGGIMVWAGISASAKTDIVFIDGNLNGQRYIDEVLTPHVLPFLCQMPVADPIFQDDNARPHRARIVDDILRVNNVKRMDLPAMSPNLSCIEHVWDVLGRAVHALPQRNTTRTSAVPKRRMGPNSTTDNQQTSLLIKKQSLGVDRVMVAIHTIDLWITFLDNPCRD